MNERPWQRALIWLLFLAPFFFISYGFANWFTAQRDDVGVIVFDWEHSIPFMAWTIVPYWTIDLFYGISLFLPRSKYELDAHAKRLLTAQVISVLCFVSFPLQFSFVRPETEGFFGWLFQVLLGFDKPYNQAPSLHISLLVILWTLYARYLLWITRLIAVLIGLSVLTTYQHHFIDIPTGALVGCLAVWLFPLHPQTVIKQQSKKRFKLACYYLTAAIVLAILAFSLRGAWLWLLWISCSLTTVAIIYSLGKPTWFRKRDGRMEEAVLVLLAPYLIGAWVNSRWWTRKHPQANEIVSGLYLSRLPSQQVINELTPVALVDCCAELPLLSEQAIYSVPILDLIEPEVTQIQQGVAAINSAKQHGNVLVFCALGYSRSATIVIAWLVEQDLAASIDDAIAKVQHAHPSLVLSEAHKEKLAQWYERR
jgi:protein-tyrosine phosphatase/membrane-associated phospholipid phosphatase